MDRVDNLGKPGFYFIFGNLAPGFLILMLLALEVDGVEQARKPSTNPLFISDLLNIRNSKCWCIWSQ